MATRKLSDGTKAYGRRWERAAKAFLIANPVCVMCAERGRIVPAEVVDHIVRHRYDADVFWDRSNWQSLCKRHHDSDKQRQEKRDETRGEWAKADGMPNDPEHPWSIARVH